MDSLPLFPEADREDKLPSFDRHLLKRRLDELARQRIFIGASSWKYEGWLGQIYTPERYYWRGRFSSKRFEQECLAEYAETFPIVCGDFSFYQFPIAAFWEKLFASASPTLQYAFKVPEEITVRSFPAHARYGPRAGQDNPSFLNAAIFDAQFLDLLRPFRDRVAVLIVEFGTFPKWCYREPWQFVEALDIFLEGLPGDFRYAVEIRNEEFLAPEYFACLREHGAAHVFNAWTRMPKLRHQIAIPGAFTTQFTVLRALLRRGRAYEQAVAQFSPYNELRDPSLSTREAMRAVISRARDRNEPAYIFVNNRLEGNAPRSIEAVLSDPG